MPLDGTKVSIRRATIRDEVIRADPDWVRTRRRIPEYTFSNGRQFFANFDTRGIYGAIDVPGQWWFNDNFNSQQYLTVGF